MHASFSCVAYQALCVPDVASIKASNIKLVSVCSVCVQVFPLPIICSKTESPFSHNIYIDQA